MDLQQRWVSAVCFSLTCCTAAYKHSKAEHCVKEREPQSRPVRDSFRWNEGRKKENSFSGRLVDVLLQSEVDAEPFRTHFSLPGAVTPGARNYREACRPPASIIHCHHRHFIPLIKKTVLISNQPLLKNYLHATIHPAPRSLTEHAGLE